MFFVIVKYQFVPQIISQALVQDVLHAKGDITVRRCSQASFTILAVTKMTIMMPFLLSGHSLTINSFQGQNHCQSHRNKSMKCQDLL